MKRLSLPSRGAPVTLDFEGDAVPAFTGEPVACALLASGQRVFSRSIKYHRPRGPFCFAAACSHCLMRVDGTPNVFTCRTPAAAGMRLERQNAYPTAQVDVFRSIDWLFPRGLDHHAMFAGVPVAEQVMAKVARHLAGLGLLPEKPAPSLPEAEIVQTQVAIVGAGPAGLAAAESLTRAGLGFVLLERDAWLGGRLAAGLPEADAPAIPEASAFPNGAIRLETGAIGFFDEARGRFLAAVQQAGKPRLVLVYAQHFILAVGGTAALPAFENNDLPGIFSARAMSLLIRRWGVLPGTAVACAGTGPELVRAAELLEQQGARVPLVLETGPAPAPGKACEGALVRAHGRMSVGAVTFRDPQGRAHKVPCDALVLAYPPSPSFELARQAGAQVAFDARCGFPVQADRAGRTAAPDLRVAGEIQGPCSCLEAAASGRRAAEGLLEVMR